jgi:hypothetical protein
MPLPPIDGRAYGSRIYQSINDQERTVSNSDEDELRRAQLGGSLVPDAFDDLAQANRRKRDGKLHLDDEKDSLYEDGLDVDDESLTLAGTQGNPNKS